MSAASAIVASFAKISDEEIVARVLAGDAALFEIIMRRYNQLLYRVSRSILRNDEEAEDVMQDAYVRVSTSGAVCRAFRIPNLAHPDCRPRSLGTGAAK